MSAELFASAGMVGIFIWAYRFLLPRAVRDRDALGLSAAVLIAVLALFGSAADRHRGPGARGPRAIPGRACGSCPSGSRRRLPVRGSVFQNRYRDELIPTLQTMA